MVQECYQWPFIFSCNRERVERKNCYNFYETNDILRYSQSSAALYKKSDSLYILPLIPTTLNLRRTLLPTTCCRILSYALYLFAEVIIFFLKNKKKETDQPLRRQPTILRHNASSHINWRMLIREVSTAATQRERSSTFTV